MSLSSLEKAGILLFLCCLPGCASEPVSSKDTSSPPLTLPSIATSELGWRRGDLHVHSTYSDGMDSVATLIELATWLEDPRFLEQHPEYLDHALDFLAITDHSSFESASDPAFKSDRLELIPGAEWNFGEGEGNILGIQQGVVVDSGGDGIDHQDVRAAVDQIHELGGLLSVNHPCIETWPFPWDLRSQDSLEVWNTGWSLGVAPSDQETLKAWEARFGEASPLFVRALEESRSHSAGQALALYQALAARGAPKAIVGGSDHHLLFLPGFPTTWIRVDEPSGVLDGLAAHHTFVSRSPAGPELLIAVTCGDDKIEAGDRCDQTGTMAVEIQTARAPAGQVRLLQGKALSSDKALPGSVLSEIAWQAELDARGEPETWLLKVEVEEGDWLMAQIMEPLVPEAEEAEHGDFLRSVARAASTASSDATAMARLLDEIVDGEALGDPDTCDPSSWSPLKLQCVLSDQTAPGTLFVPDLLNRAFNAETIDGEPTGTTVGALGSVIWFGALVEQ